MYMYPVIYWNLLYVGMYCSLFYPATQVSKTHVIDIRTGHHTHAYDALRKSDTVTYVHQKQIPSN